MIYTDAQNKHITKKTTVLYGMFELGNSTLGTLMSTHMTFFFTDIMRIPALSVTFMYGVTRIFDAVNDPICGMLADRTRTKLGVYRPWTVFSAIPYALAFIVLFSGSPDWGDPVKLAFMWITYLLFTFCATCSEVPYGAMSSTLTVHANERTILNTSRTVFMNISSIVCMSAVVWLISNISVSTGSQVFGYNKVMLLVGILTIPFFLISSMGLKEVVIPKKSPKVSKKTFVNAFVKNKSLLLVMLSVCGFGLAATGRYSSYVFYFTYVCGDLSLLANFNILFTVFGVIGALLVPKLTAKKGNKGIWTIIACVIFSVSSLLCIWLSPATSMIGFYILCAFQGIGCGMYSPCTYSMLSDCVEVGYLQTGERNASLIYAGANFMRKVGYTIGAMLLTSMLAFTSYDPGMASQAQDALDVITLNTLVLPAIITMATCLPLLAYKMNKAEFKKVLTQIEEMEAAGNR